MLASFLASLLLALPSTIVYDFSQPEYLDPWQIFGDHQSIAIERSFGGRSGVLVIQPAKKTGDERSQYVLLNSQPVDHNTHATATFSVFASEFTEGQVAFSITCQKSDGTMLGIAADTTTVTRGGWHEVQLDVDIDPATAFIVYSLATDANTTIGVDKITIDIDGATPEYAVPSFSLSDEAKAKAIKERVLLSEHDGLLQRLSGHSVIGLGESTHGTKEFIAMKQEVIRTLAEAGKLDKVYIEAAVGGIFAIDEVTSKGGTEIDSLVGDLVLWLWKTPEFKDFLKWVGTYNRAAPQDKKIRLYGVDVQFLGGNARVLNRVRHELKLKPSKAVADLLDGWQDYDVPKLQSFEREEHAGLRAAKVVKHFFTSKKKQLTKQYGEPKAKEILRLAQTFEEFYVLSSDYGNVLRDSLMANNISAPRFGKSSVFWAHNTHVSLSSPFAGEHLRRKFRDYLSVALMNGGGTYLAEQQDSLVVSELKAIPNSIELALANVDHRPYYIRTKSLDGLNFALSMSVGLTVRNFTYLLLPITDLYDAILFSPIGTAVTPVN